MGKIKDRKIVVVNQASNYLTVGFCNAFATQFETVALVTGSVHVQGEELDAGIEVTYINKWVERPASKKMLSYLKACLKIYWLLLTKYRGYEVFFVSIPPMGYLLNLILPHRFSMVIWDVSRYFQNNGYERNASVIPNLGCVKQKILQKSIQTFYNQRENGRFGRSLCR